jgi:hypothetical protein
MTIKAADGAAPIIDGSGINGVFKIWHSGSDFNGGEVVIEGFDITGNSTTSIAVTAAMCATGDTTKIVIRDNDFHGMVGGFNAWGSGSFCTETDQEARVENVEIIGNEFYDLGVTGVQGGFGVYLEGLSDWTSAGNQFAAMVEDNVFRNILYVSGTEGGVGIGIESPNAANNEAANARIANNIFEDTVNIGIGILAGDVMDTEIVGNSFATNTVGVNYPGTGTVDASRNWWGSADGPVSSQIVGSVNYTPWYATATTTPATQNVSVERIGEIVAYSDTIQGAIDAASAGDTINVAAGTYTHQTESSPYAGMIVIDKGLTLRAADGVRPVLDGSGDDGVIKIWPQALEDGFPVVIEGFEITGNAVVSCQVV